MTMAPQGSRAQYIVPAARLLWHGARSLLTALLLTQLPGFIPGSVAQPGEPYGERYVRSGASWPGEAPSPLPVLEPLTASELAALEQRVEALELAQGPFSGGLSEVLGDLARALEASGKLGEANAARERALHLVRVNDGLNSPVQLPLLRSQLQSDRRRGDFEALDARYDYYWRLLGRGQAPFTPLRFGAALEYQRWQREALRRRLDDGTGQRMLQLLETGTELIDALQLSADPDPQQLREAVFSQLRNYYLFASLVQPPRDTYSPRSGFRQPRFLNEEIDGWDPQREKLQNRRRGLRREGEELLREQLELNPEPQARAELLLALGDWAQWWEDTDEALQAYSRCWATMREAGQQALVASWFAEPRPLPDSGVFLAPEEPLISGVPMSIQVDERGRAQGDLLVDSDTLPRDARRLPRLIRDTRFRPAMRDGAAVPQGFSEIRFDVFD
jgi:hypothetical protein